MQSSHRGSALLYVIASIVLMGAVGGGVAYFSSSSSTSAIIKTRTDQAYYAAMAGINYARTFKDSDFQAIIAETDSQKQFTLDDSTFTLTVGAKSGSDYPVESLGAAAHGTPLAANHHIGPVDIPPVASSRPPLKGISGAYVNARGNITGDVIGVNINISDGTTITGSVISTSTTSTLTISGGTNIATVSGLICARNGVSITGGSKIYGDIHAPSGGGGVGSVFIGGGSEIYANIYADDTISFNGNPKIYGDTHSQKNVLVTNATFGTSSKKQRILSNLEPYITGGETIYTDIHSQTGVQLDNIKLFGDIYSINTPVTHPHRTKWTGNHYNTPTFPTAPNQCLTYDSPQSIDVEATESLNLSWDGVKTFTAGDYYFTSINANWSSKICFDTSGGNINIFVSGPVSSAADIYVKTSTQNNCFTNKMTSINESYYPDAKYVFLYTGNSFTVMGSQPWFGTVLALNNVIPNSANIIGSLHSISGTVNPNNTWYNIRVVEPAE